MSPIKTRKAEKGNIFDRLDWRPAKAPHSPQNFPSFKNGKIMKMKSVVVAVKNQIPVTSLRGVFKSPQRHRASSPKLPSTPGKALNLHEINNDDTLHKFWSDFDQEHVDITCNENEIDNLLNKSNENYATSFQSSVLQSCFRLDC